MRTFLAGFVLFCGALVNGQAPTAAPKPAAAKPKPDPANVQLIGNRFKPLKYAEMTPEQQTMVKNLVEGERGGTGGPFNVLLRNPAMGDLAQKLGAEARFHAEVPDKLKEMAIIMTARHWTSHFEWNAHRRAAAQAGLAEAKITAIAAGKKPAGMDAEEEMVYNFANELLNSPDHQVSDATFNAAVKTFGERRVVNITTVMGYYGLVSMLLNIDRYPLPEGVAEELKPLR